MYLYLFSLFLFVSIYFLIEEIFINPLFYCFVMYVVVGLTVGKSSMSFEGRYKTSDDVKDVHVSDTPKVNHVLQSFLITNDSNDLVL